MIKIKRRLGILWMLLGPVAMYFLVKTALGEMEKKPLIDTYIQWGIFVVVLFPISIGLVIFGYYAWKGDYDHLPVQSDEID